MKKKYSGIFILGLSVLILFINSCTDRESTAQKEWLDPLNETVAQRDARMAWWR